MAGESRRSEPPPRRPSHMSHRHPGLLTKVRNLERIGHVSELAIRHGFGYFFERHHLWDLVPGRRRSSLPPAAGQRGRHLRELLEELGPTYVKFGQLLSTRADLVPLDIVQELVKLQDRVPPFPFETARQVIEEDLGLSLERRFVAFDPEPIASASIGQVYRAVAPGGREVAVKVQRPGVREQIKRDVSLFYQLAEILVRRTGGELIADPVQLVDEFSAAITRETDYRLEGRNAERFAGGLAGDQEVCIPRVMNLLCGPRVLTLEFLHGAPFSSLQPEQLPAAERERLSRLITELWFKMVLRDGYFHGDPHPANLLLMPDGRVGLVDFGSAGVLTSGDLEQGIYLFNGVAQRDPAAVRRSLKHLGLRWPMDSEDQLRESLEGLFHRYYGLSIQQVDSGELLRDVFQMLFGLQIRVPARFLLLERAIMTLEGVVASINPNLNIFEVARPYARSLVLRRLAPEVLLSKVARAAQEVAETAEELPGQLRRILEQTAAGELRIRFLHTGLDDLVHHLDLLTNRVVVAVVAAALALASAIILTFVESGPHLFGLSIWGIPGFVVALFFGVWLLWAIFRSGRL